MRGTEQLPLTGTGWLAPPHEPITAPDGFDLPKHGLDRLPASLVQPAPPLGQQGSLPSLPGRQVRGDASAGWGLLALGLALFPVLVGRDQQLGAGRHHRREVGVTAIPGIGQRRADSLRVTDRV